MVNTRAINGCEGRERGELDVFRVIPIGAKHTQTRGGEAADGSAGSHGSRAGSEAHSRGTSEAEDRGHCVCVVCRCRAGEESGRKDRGKLNHRRRGDGTAAKQETREGDGSCGKRTRFGGGKKLPRGKWPVAGLGRPPESRVPELQPLSKVSGAVSRASAGSCL